jgi:transposase-like protein
VAGQPIARHLAERIEADGGDLVIFDRIGSGEAVKRIAEDYGVGYETLRRWINKSDERRKAYEQAKRDSADALVEEAGEILDNAPTDSAPQVTKAVKRADHKRWLAGKRDREQYGDDKGAQVNVNLDLGALHLDALRAAGRMPEPEEIPTADVEILTDGEPDTGEAD